MQLYFAELEKYAVFGKEEQMSCSLWWDNGSWNIWKQSRIVQTTVKIQK